jgi:uncharacterized membrane protein
VNEEQPHNLALEREIGLLLRLGVVTATVVVVAGGCLFLARHGREPAHYAIFHGEPRDLRTLPGVLSGLAMAKGRAVIQLGLLLLIATPVARVGLTLIAFARMRDTVYVVITAIVFAMLVFSLCAAPS